jgi:hypothetical protein
MSGTPNFAIVLSGTGLRLASNDHAALRPERGPRPGKPKGRSDAWLGPVNGGPAQNSDVASGHLVVGLSRLLVLEAGKGHGREHLPGLRRGLVSGGGGRQHRRKDLHKRGHTKRELATTSYRDGLDVRLPSFMER